MTIDHIEKRVAEMERHQYAFKKGPHNMRALREMRNMLVSIDSGVAEIAFEIGRAHDPKDAPKVERLLGLLRRVVTVYDSVEAIVIEMQKTSISGTT